MAKECGWDYKYIIKNFTLKQIQRYYETITLVKNEDHARICEGIFYATGGANGNIKTEKLEEYLGYFVKRPKQKTQDILRQIKEEGLPLEEN